MGRIRILPMLWLTGDRVLGDSSAGEPDKENRKSSIWKRFTGDHNMGNRWIRSMTGCCLTKECQNNTVKSTGVHQSDEEMLFTATMTSVHLPWWYLLKLHSLMCNLLGHTNDKWDDVNNKQHLDAIMLITNDKLNKHLEAKILELARSVTTGKTVDIQWCSL